MGLADIVAEKVIKAVEKKLGVDNLGQNIEKLFGDKLGKLDFQGFYDRLAAAEKSISEVKEDVSWIRKQMEKRPLA